MFPQGNMFTNTKQLVWLKMCNILPNYDRVCRPYTQSFPRSRSTNYRPPREGNSLERSALVDRVAVCWDGEWPGQRKNSVLQSPLPAHHPPSSSHPVAICSDAGQRNRRRIGVDQTTPQREGEQGGAWQGVACHSTSSTGQYRTA